VNLPEQVFAKDISNIQTVVNWAADMQLRGSFSDRRPDLGKMVCCPHCGIRRRTNGPRCCNPEFATTQRAWTPEMGFHQVECAERSNPNPFSKQFMRKFRHKRHGQSRNFKIRHLVFLFQNNATLLNDAAMDIQVNTPDVAAIPAFAEKYFLWKVERRDRMFRRQATRSRQINR